MSAPSNAAAAVTASLGILADVAGLLVDEPACRPRVRTEDVGVDVPPDPPEVAERAREEDAFGTVARDPTGQPVEEAVDIVERQIGLVGDGRDRCALCFPSVTRVERGGDPPHLGERAAVRLDEESDQGQASEVEVVVPRARAALARSDREQPLAEVVLDRGGGNARPRRELPQFHRWIVPLSLSG